MALRRSERLEALSCTSVGPTRIAERMSLRSLALRVAVTALIAERKSLIVEASRRMPVAVSSERRSEFTSESRDLEATSLGTRDCRLDMPLSRSERSEANVALTAEAMSEISEADTLAVMPPILLGKSE